MTNEEYINNEVRVRFLEEISREASDKLNTLITLNVIGLIMQVLFFFFHR